MLDQIYLTEEEKDKLSKKYNDYISNAIHKSDNELHRITKKYLLPKSKETKNNYQHYYEELSKTGEEITTQISKDEASLPRHRVKKWTKIQAIRNKAYNLHAYWHPKIRHADKKIKYADIIRQIEKKEDRVSKKYYNKIFDKEKISEKLIGGSKISLCKTAASISSFITAIFADVISIIFCILMAINRLIFMDAQQTPFISQTVLGLFLICAFATFVVTRLTHAILDNHLLDLNIILAADTYLIYLGFSIYTTLIIKPEIIKATVFILLPLLFRLSILLFKALEYIFLNTIDKHYVVYKQYYNFLDKK
jgi:hypothetical protein